MKQTNLSGFVKEVQRDNPRFSEKVSLNLSIIKRLQDFKAADVAHQLGMQMPALSYHLKRLQVLGIVEKKGYGVWQVIISEEGKIRDVLQKEVQRKYPIRSSKDGGVKFTELLSDSVRTHAIQAVVYVPHSVRRWTSPARQQFLSENGVRFKVIQQGEQIFIDDCRVWLTRKSIVIWMPRSWFAKDAETGYSYAIHDLQKVIRKIEVTLKVGLRQRGKYAFRIARQHHALVKNALAVQFNRDREKLYVYDTRGLWLLIDDSEGLSETEGVANRGPNGSDSRDHIARVQDWFNGVKSTGITPEGILAMLQQNASQTKYYADNIAAHVVAVKEMQAAASELRAAIKGGRI